MYNIIYRKNRRRDLTDRQMDRETDRQINVNTEIF